jgi:3(or 17)beta-hydroxysteroid dehydrogenase
MSGSALAGKSAVVTGGASGIGAAVAEAMVQAGAEVTIVDRDRKTGRSRAKTIGAHFEAMDVTREEDWMSLRYKLLTRSSSLDILVNNAGGGGLGTIDDLSLTQWNSIITLNLTASFLGVRALMPLLRSGSSASIVNIASTSAVRPWAAFTAYASAKAGLSMLTKCIAQHCIDVQAPVRCNTVLPGPIRTENFEQLTERDPDSNLLQSFMRLNPNSRVGAPADIAHAVVFLCSDEAQYINGVDLVVAGGTLV